MSRANEPAFPIGSGDMRDPTGMSLREYYAGLAMAGIVANSRCEMTDMDVARAAVSLADTLIAALEAK